MLLLSWVSDCSDRRRLLLIVVRVLHHSSEVAGYFRKRCDRRAIRKRSDEILIVSDRRQRGRHWSRRRVRRPPSPHAPRFCSVSAELTEIGPPLPDTVNSAVPVDPSSPYPLSACVLSALATEVREPIDLRLQLRDGCRSGQHSSESSADLAYVHW